MENRNNGLKVAVVAALVISVLGVAVGFAAFSTTLEINGAATVEAANWDVHFEKLAKATSDFTATEDTAPTIKANTDGKAAAAIGDYAVTFTKPGQKAVYTFDIVNTGTYNATLTSITMKNVPTCTGTAADEDQKTTDATNVCKHLKYTLTGVNEGSSLAAKTGKVETVTLTLEYEDFEDETELPTAPVTVSDLDVALLYSQAD